MLPKVAAITMVYNEAALLPVWARHYAHQVGADHCYVVDHGSTDAIVLPPGVNKFRLPRSPHDDERRAFFIADFVSGLLKYYDWVVYTDVDELVLADPGEYENLPRFCAGANLPATGTAIGFDIQQIPALEPALDLGQRIGRQREWVRFTSAMCKPLLTSQPVMWSPGFHSSQHRLVFAGLYLFHLHWVDFTLGLARLEKTRDMAWAGENFGRHQRVSTAAWIELFEGMAKLPRRDDVVIHPDVDPLQGWLHRTASSNDSSAGAVSAVDLGINADELWQIPSQFRARL